jgi:hypothetical protein
MNNDQSWAVRGLTSQNWAVMQSLIAILEDKRLTKNRCRDLVRQLEYMAEQVKALEPAA